MKKRLIQLALILGLMTLTCIAAQATDSAPTSGFRNLSIEADYKDSVSLSPLDALGKTVNPDENTLYPGAAKVDVTYKSPTKDSEYLLIVLSDNNQTPSVDNMAYIDQKTAESSDLKFTVYPKKSTEKSVTYSVYLSSNDGTLNYVKVASFEYYSTGADFLLGDADNNGERPDLNDAVMILRWLVKDPEARETMNEDAADVDGEGGVTVNDAVEILRFLVRDPDAILWKLYAQS